MDWRVRSMKFIFRKMMEGKKRKLREVRVSFEDEYAFVHDSVYEPYLRHQKCGDDKKKTFLCFLVMESDDPLWKFLKEKDTDDGEFLALLKKDADHWLKELGCLEEYKWKKSDPFSFQKCYDRDIMEGKVPRQTIEKFFMYLLQLELRPL
jgi:hypothetical protein